MKKFLIIISLCFIVYFNALLAVPICDDANIIGNRQVARQMLFSKVTSLDGLIYRFNSAVFGINNTVIGHLFNICLHIIACILVFYFLRIFFAEMPSLLATSLFAVLPIHTENITFLSGSGHIFECIYILTIFLLFYHKKYILSFAAFALFLFPLYHAPWVGLTPVFIIAYLLTYKRFREILWTVPYFLIFEGVILLNRSAIDARIVAHVISTGKTWVNPFKMMVFSVLNHTWLMIFPKELTIYHEPYFTTKSFMLRGSILLLIILILMPYLYKKAKPIFLGILMLFIFLAPTYSPISIGWLLAERYAYTASIFLSICLAWLVVRFGKKIIPICLVIIALYAARTIDRNADYKTEARFWHTAVATAPFSYQARNALGKVYAEESNIIRAFQAFNNSLRIRPDFKSAKDNLEIMKGALERGINIKY